MILWCVAFSSSSHWTARSLARFNYANCKLEAERRWATDARNWHEKFDYRVCARAYYNKAISSIVSRRIAGIFYSVSFSGDLARSAYRVVALHVCIVSNRGCAKSCSRAFFTQLYFAIRMRENCSSIDVLNRRSNAAWEMLVLIKMYKNCKQSANMYVQRCIFFSRNEKSYRMTLKTYKRSWWIKINRCL